jgi:cellobiose epimerase
MQRHFIRSGFQSGFDFRHRAAKIAAALALALCAVGAVACSNRPSPPITKTELVQGPVTESEITSYAAAARNELLNDILPYWLAHAPNEANGGFYGSVSREGEPDADAPRGALLTSRILWTFSAAYRHTNDPRCLDMAKRAYADLTDHFADKKNGGLYWAIDANGKPTDTRKIIYGQSFGIYALSEYYRATGDKAALDKAIGIYRNMESHARDHENGGYYEEFSSDWQIAKASSMRGNALGAPGHKSQNTHIHILEAYTNLLRAWPDDTLRHDLGDLQDVLLTKLLNAKTHHLTLFFSDDWTPYNDAISYGHDIEFSWLLVESAEVLNDPARLEKAKAAAVEIAKVTSAEGVDADGGLFNEGDAKGVTNADKDWWPQAEAAVGFANAWTISNDPRYLRESRRSWDFIEKHIVDHRHGEWFRAVGRNGEPLRWQEKIGFWKCPYHNGRACMELIDRLEAAEARMNSKK